MQTKAQIAANVKANLADPRMHGICLFIDALIKRNKPEIGLPVYRITNKVTGTPITSVADFIAAVSADHLTHSYPFQGERNNSDRVTGYSVVLTNMTVEFDVNSKEDLFFTDQYNYFADFGRLYNFSFHMAYLNDADTELPVKTASVRLVIV